MHVADYLSILWRLWRRTPTFLSFNVTNRCNESCPMCNIRRAPAEEMTPAEAGRIFADLAGFGIRVVEISGGEPFLRTDLSGIIRQLDHLKLLYTITTNGTVWNEETVRALCSSKGLLQLAVSLDSLKPEVYRLLRGSDALDTVLGNIDRFAAAGLKAPLKINFTMSRHNANEAFDMLEFARKRGLCLSVFPANSGPGRVHSSDDPVMAATGGERERMAGIFRELARLRRQGEPLWEFSRFYETAADYLLDRPIGDCGAGHLFLDLRSDGRLAVCIEREPFADLRTEPVAEALARLAGERLAAADAGCRCCYTCTFNVNATAQNPLGFVLESLRVRLRQRSGR